MNKFRSRKFCMLLYPLEDETHRRAIEYIKLNYDYALIVHDLDKNEEGEYKKSHTHVVLSASNAKWNTALASELGIELNYIQNCRSYNNALEYLVHYNDDTKHQYSLDNVQGTLKTKLKRILANDGKDESTKAYELMDFINNYDGHLSLKQVCDYACELGYWDVVRRGSYLFIRLIDEHNSELKLT